MTAELDKINYALNKQVSTAYAVETDYGQIPLTGPLGRAVKRAMEKELLRQRKAVEQREQRKAAKSHG